MFKTNTTNPLSIDPRSISAKALAKLHIDHYRREANACEPETERELAMEY